MNKIDINHEGIISINNSIIEKLRDINIATSHFKTKGIRIEKNQKAL